MVHIFRKLFCTNLVYWHVSQHAFFINNEVEIQSNNHQQLMIKIVTLKLNLIICCRFKNYSAYLIQPCAMNFYSRGTQLNAENCILQLIKLLTFSIVLWVSQ